MQDQELTGWFELSDQKPWEPGVYEVNSFAGGTVYSYWSGSQFMYICKSIEDAYSRRSDQTYRLQHEFDGAAFPPTPMPSQNQSAQAIQR